MAFTGLRDCKLVPCFLTVSLSVCLSVCQPVCLSVALTVYLSNCMSARLCVPMCPTVHWPACPIVGLLACLTICRLTVGPSVYLHVCLPVCTSVQLPHSLSVCKSVHGVALFILPYLIRLTDGPSVYLHVCLPTCLSICLYVRLSVCLSICSSASQSVCLSVCLIYLTLVSSTLQSYKVRKILASKGLKDCRLMVSLLPEPSALSLIASSGLFFTPSSLNSWLIPK